MPFFAKAAKMLGHMPGFFAGTLDLLTKTLEFLTLVYDILNVIKGILKLVKSLKDGNPGWELQVSTAPFFVPYSPVIY